MRGLAGTISRSPRERLPGSDLKWVAPGNIHVTLKFLGEVSLSGSMTCNAPSEGGCRNNRPMRLSVREPGAFPLLGRHG